MSETLNRAAIELSTWIRNTERNLILYFSEGLQGTSCICRMCFGSTFLRLDYYCQLAWFFLSNLLTLVRCFGCIFFYCVIFTRRFGWSFWRSKSCVPHLYFRLFSSIPAFVISFCSWTRLCSRESGKKSTFLDEPSPLPSNRFRFIIFISFPGFIGRLCWVNSKLISEPWGRWRDLDSLFKKIMWLFLQR